MNKSLTLLAGTLCVALMPVVASAQQAGPDSVHFKVGDQPVVVHSVEPNSVKGDYHIDFAKLDRNHDGYISRSEARQNPTLHAEFNAVDVHHRGRLSRKDLAGWAG